MTVAITLMEAYLIETPLAKGMSSSTLINHLKQGDSQAINSFDNTFDYTELLEAYENNSTNIEEAIQSSYTIKFVSIYGIKRLIHLKFGLEEEVDYKAEDDKLLNIHFNEKQLSTFKKLLSPNWHVQVEEVKQGLYKVDVLHVTTINK